MTDHKKAYGFVYSNMQPEESGMKIHLQYDVIENCANEDGYKLTHVAEAYGKEEREYTLDDVLNWAIGDKVDRVYISDYNRISRSPTELRERLKVFETSGVHLIAADPDYIV